MKLNSGRKNMYKEQYTARDCFVTVGAAALELATPAKADSLTPDSFSETIGVSSMTSITDKIGVISVGAAKAARPICFLISPDSKAG
jgi:hypothetical protein